MSKFDDFLAEQLKDSEVKAEYDALVPEFNDEAADEASLLALAEERMKDFDPSKVITQAEIDAEFGFEKK